MFISTRRTNVRFQFFHSCLRLGRSLLRISVILVIFRKFSKLSIPLQSEGGTSIRPLQSSSRFYQHLREQMTVPACPISQSSDRIANVRSRRCLSRKVRFQRTILDSHTVWFAFRAFSQFRSFRQFRIFSVGFWKRVCREIRSFIFFKKTVHPVRG